MKGLSYQIIYIQVHFDFRFLEYYQNMLISPEEYLCLTDQIALLSLRSKTYQSENKKLTEQIIKQKETIQFLNQRLQQQVLKQKQTQQELIKHVTKTSQNVKSHMSIQTSQQMKYFDEQINKIKNDANVQKIKQIEKKMTQSRFINHQMVDFYQKIDSLYKVLNKVNKSPPMPQLYKWVSIRKAEELLAMFLPNNGGTQQAINGNMSMSRAFGTKTSISKQKNTMSLSKAKNMEISKNNFNSSKVGMISSQKSGVVKRSSIKGQGKQNNSEQKRKNQYQNNKPPINKKKQQKQIQIASTESLTQEMNVGTLSQIENASQVLIVGNNVEDKTKIQQSMVKVNI